MLVYNYYRFPGLLDRDRQYFSGS